MSHPSVSRRTALRQLAVLSAAGGAAQLTHAAEPAATPPAAAPVHPPPTGLREGQEQIAILVYPEFTALDALGPHYALSGMMGASVRFVAKTREPVRCEGARDGGLLVQPHLTFDECRDRLDLLLVPGGLSGTMAAIADPATRAFVARAGRQARCAASVCTGSLLLGAAGLLNGRRATSHWQTLDLLREVGATPVAERVVFDGTDRATAAGVSAGLDLGFALVQRYRGDFYAKGMQLLGEYDPQPPFPKGGNPRTADREVVDLLDQMHAPVVAKLRDLLRAARHDADGVRYFGP